MAGLDDEWNEALDEEYGEASEAPEELDEPEEPETPEEPEQAEEDTDTPEEPETPDEEPEEPEDEETPEEPEKPEELGDDPEEKPATREEIKAALLELEKERTTRDTGLNQMKDEVLSTLYPEGVDRELRDADGDPIKGIEDLTGVDPQTGAQVGAGLINPITDEVFTEDEAARYILRGQQKLNEQVQLMEDQAYKIAETHLSLKESSEKIEADFGHILDKLPPEISKRIQESYLKTLRRDPQTGLVVDVPLDPYEFYAIALAGAKPFIPAAGNQPARAPASAPQPAPPRTDKGDRADLGQRGTPSKLSQEEREWEEAFNEVLN